MKYRSVTFDDRVAEFLMLFDYESEDFPDLAVVYFEQPDSLGHYVGPFHSRV